MIAPVYYRWSGEAMEPLPRYVEECNRDFIVGEVYRMEIMLDRSVASHGHYFASVTEAWKNLPHDKALLFPTPDKLRRWCLIKTGWANEQSMVCESTTDAARFAMMLGRMNEDSVVVRKGRVIKIYTAKSQSVRAMDKADFENSKRDVLDLLVSMIGTTVEELKTNAGKAA